MKKDFKGIYRQIEWNRWTIGFSYDYEKYLSGQWTCSIDIYLPVFSLIIYFEHNGV
tara:strand:+ start:42 stop:209 length:168 start_codon:yes stop_codon:yes gene_type:complete